MKSIRETAEEIAERFIGSGDNVELRRARCVTAIEQALRNERERCAKIAERRSPVCLHCGTALIIAAEIRQIGLSHDRQTT